MAKITIVFEKDDLVELPLNRTGKIANINGYLWGKGYEVEIIEGGTFNQPGDIEEFCYEDLKLIENKE